MSPPRHRRLALILATAEDLEVVAELCHAACRAGLTVELFAMADGVLALAAAPARVAGLRDAGCEIVVCARSASERGLGDGDLDARSGSQDDHAALVARADRVLAFT